MMMLHVGDDISIGSITNRMVVIQTIHVHLSSVICITGAETARDENNQRYL